jgi:hypothetical protein
MADMAAPAAGNNSRYSYNAAAAVAAAAQRESSAAYLSSAGFNSYAAAYAHMSWNNYTIAAYQGLQREGVTFGKNFEKYLAILIQEQLQ